MPLEYKNLPSAQKKNWDSLELPHNEIINDVAAIKKKHQELARKYHPDSLQGKLHGTVDQEKFGAASNAYIELSLYYNKFHSSNVEHHSTQAPESKLPELNDQLNYPEALGEFFRYAPLLHCRELINLRDFTIKILQLNENNFLNISTWLSSYKKIFDDLPSENRLHKDATSTIKNCYEVFIKHFEDLANLFKQEKDINIDSFTNNGNEILRKTKEDAKKIQNFLLFLIMSKEAKQSPDYNQLKISGFFQETSAALNIPSLQDLTTIIKTSRNKILDIEVEDRFDTTETGNFVFYLKNKTETEINKLMQQLTQNNIQKHFNIGHIFYIPKNDLPAFKNAIAPKTAMVRTIN